MTIANIIRSVLRSLARDRQMTFMATSILVVGLTTFNGTLAVIDRYTINRLPFRASDHLFAFSQGARTPPPEWLGLKVTGKPFTELRTTVAQWMDIAMVRRAGTLRIRHGSGTVLLPSLRATPSLIEVLDVRHLPLSADSPAVRVLISQKAAMRLGFDSSENEPTAIVDGRFGAPLQFAGLLPVDFVMPLKGGGPDVEAIILDPVLAGEPYSSGDVLIGRVTEPLSITPATEFLRRELPFHLQANLVSQDLRRFVGGAFDDMVIRASLGIASAVMVVSIAGLCILFAIRRVLRNQEWLTRRYLGATDSDLLRHCIVEVSIIVMASTVIALWLCALIAMQLERITGTYIWSLVDVASIERLAVISGIVALLVMSVVILTIWVAGRPKRRSLRGASVYRAIGIASQLAMSTVLVVAGGSIATSLVNLFGQDTGFDSTSVVVSVSYPTSTNPSALDQKMIETLDAIRQIPDVKFVGAAVGATLDRLLVMGSVKFLGSSIPVMVKEIAGDYFPASGGTILIGTTARARDEVVVNEAFARAAGTADLLGERVRADPDLTITGIAKNELGFALDAAPRPTIFRPARLIWRDCTGEGCGQVSYIVKRTSERADVTAAISRAIQREAQGAALISIGEVGERLRFGVAKRTILSVLVIFFAVATACASFIGITSIVSFTVTNRSKEMAIRATLGATSGRLLKAAIADVLIGISMGVLIGIFLGRFVVGYARYLLYGVLPGDWTPQLAALVCFVTMAVVVAISSIAPAVLRSPAAVLRTE